MITQPIIGLLFGLMLICLGSTAKADHSKHLPRIFFYVTVDWEGIDFHSDILDPADIRKVEAFRLAYPNIPMIHFLNAAYYTNGSLGHAEVTRRIKQTLLPIDEIGLHLHTWENLVRAAGVPFIDGPTYLGKRKSPFRRETNERFPEGHRGGDVALWRYSEEHIRRLIEFSLKILKENGFEDIDSFRAGGWMSDPIVLKVLAELGFVIDSSGVPWENVAKLYPNTPLVQAVRDIWGHIRPTSQPYIHQATNDQSIILKPNNAGLADYIDADAVMRIVWQNLLKHHTTRRDIHIVYGFHLESAVKYLDRVAQVVEQLETFASVTGIEVVPSTFRSVRQSYPRSLENLSRCESSVLNINR